MARDVYGRSFNQYGRLEFPEQLSAEQSKRKQAASRNLLDWVASKSPLPFDQWLQERGQ